MDANERREVLEGKKSVWPEGIDEDQKRYFDFENWRLNTMLSSVFEWSFAILVGVCRKNKIITRLHDWHFVLEDKSLTFLYWMRRTTNNGTAGHQFLGHGNFDKISRSSDRSRCQTNNSEREELLMTSQSWDVREPFCQYEDGRQERGPLCKSHVRYLRTCFGYGSNRSWCLLAVSDELTVSWKVFHDIRIGCTDDAGLNLEANEARR